MAVQDILRRYEEQLDMSYGVPYVPNADGFSREYSIFRREALTVISSLYEDFCNFSDKILRIEIKAKDEEKLKESIDIANLDITPSKAYSAAILLGIVIILLGALFLLFSLFTGGFTLGPLMAALFVILFGFVVIKILTKFPDYLAYKWRLDASNQMVLCILYIVMYMRHTSNLEHAIRFAAVHAGNPLALDLKKVFWNVETGRFSTIKNSLDNYLMRWKEYSLEFVEAFHLIEGSLSEANEQRRVEMLEKSIEVMLDGTYERMLHFTHDLKSPITALYMLGIVLPILGLVIFPLVSAFLGGVVQWYHLAVLYNIILPVFVFGYGNYLLSKRPTGYGENDILKQNPMYMEYYNNKSALFMGVFIVVIFLAIGFLPLVLHYTNPELDQASFLEGSTIGGKIQDFKCNDECIGPYGIVALILSLFIPLGIALGYGTYCRMKSKELIDIRNKTKKLELEFTGSLFQLGNRVADGIPVEVAFGDVAENMKGTPTGDFFRNVTINLRKLGMSVKEAVFNKDRGAILLFPSSLIESSMKILVQAARKSPYVVSKSLTSISVYVDRIHKVNERLKDLLADIISSMKSQVSFLTPMIAAIVVGVASMIVSIVNKLGEQFAEANVGSFGESAGGIAGLANILSIEDVIPGFYFQIVVGLFVVEMIILLTILANSLENGNDKISEKNSLAKNLYFGTALYVVISLIGIFIFNVLANGISLVGG